MTDPADRTRFLNGVRNVRRFRDEPVPEEALRGVLEVARWSGSSMNRQPWSFVVVREPALLRALAATSPSIGWVAGAPAAIVPVLDGEAPEDETFDEGRLGERILLGARAHGLGAGLGWFPHGTARTEARALLGVPDGRVVRTVIALGHPANGERGGRAAARKPLADLVFDERYGRRPT